MKLEIQKTHLKFLNGPTTNDWSLDSVIEDLLEHYSNTLLIFPR